MMLYGFLLSKTKTIYAQNDPRQNMKKTAPSMSLSEIEKDHFQGVAFLMATMVHPTPDIFFIVRNHLFADVDALPRNVEEDEEVLWFIAEIAEVVNRGADVILGAPKEEHLLLGHAFLELLFSMLLGKVGDH